MSLLSKPVDVPLPDDNLLEAHGLTGAVSNNFPVRAVDRVD